MTKADLPLEDARLATPERQPAVSVRGEAGGSATSDVIAAEVLALKGTAATNGIQTTRPSGPRTYYRFAALALITLVIAISAGDRATLSIAGPHMSRDLGLSASRLGWLFSAFAWSYVIAQVPSGWITDRFGTRPILFGGLALWSMTTLLMCTIGWVAAPFVAMIVLRFLLGLFESPVGPTGTVVVAEWFPAQERGIAGGVASTAPYASLVLFSPLMGWLDHRFGWEYIFGVMGALGLVLAAVVALFYYSPLEHPRVSESELEYIRAGGGLVGLATSGDETVPKRAAARFGLGSLFRSRMLVGIFIAQYCITSITWFFVTWFPSYLVKARGLSVMDASLISTIPAVCGFAGGILTGFVSDWLLKRTNSLTIARKVPITIGLGMTVLVIACNYTNSTPLIVLFMSAAFFGKGFGSLGFTVVADTAPQELVGMTAGVLNALGNVGGIVAPVVIGYLVSASGSFTSALVYVGFNGVVAIASYWFVVGRIERFDPSRIADQRKSV